MKKLNYHQNAIEQLHWVPESIGLPIFLSLSNSEIVWWNLSLSKFQRTVHRQSRMGSMSSSCSSPNISISPRSSFTINNSKSVDFNRLSISSTDSNLNGSLNGSVDEKLKSFWLLKTGKDSQNPEMLGTLPLPTICTTKICVSNDFVKFLTIDSYGSITKYKIFQK